MRWLGHSRASGPYPVPVGFCIKEKQWKKEMEAFGCPEVAMPDCEACVTQLKQDGGGRQLIVSFRLAKDRSRIEIAGFVAHEATHVWQFIKQAIAEEAPGWEVEACAVQWITQWLLECLEAERLWK